MHIEVKQGSAATTKSGVTQKGKPYSIREQEVWFHADGQIFKSRVVLNGEQVAHPPGLYDIDGSSFGVNRFGELELQRLILKPRFQQPGARA